MLKLLTKSPLTHALAWVGIYVGSVNVLDAISASLGVMHLATSLGLLGLSLLSLLYLSKNKLSKRFGLNGVKRDAYKKMLYFIPLIILGLSQFTGELNPDLNGYQIALFVLLMANVGFLEELIFRGYLYEAIKSKSGTNRAIFISGITFGLGHIVNLMRGMSIDNQIEQIIVAIVLGILLAKIVAITNSLLPGILFHIVFNISGSIMLVNPSLNTLYIFGILILASLYLLHLMRVKTKHRDVVPLQSQA
jgi:hypothetical protein